ncbi:glycoside hydrolase [Jaminaea rosea]|uniref:glucan endo-1,3-beta-D-glucosidase n=1 Tax=Jaminaea rosea TaxID=1569628 RepID=A0A316UY55_9BASI|nr:glycoside hydrolase [Jaminaea rosea]PWN29718.1 glycoside hydrolase [Jaminaea rosea]
MPTNVPDSVDNWWCSTQDEQAWLGFSYDVSWCPSSAQLTKSFKRMRSEYNARYVRMYGTCDNDGFTDQLINAGWEAGLGIYPLIWFGFDGDNKWQTRRDNIIKAIKSNSKAPYVVRGVVVGSEPMFDSVMSPDDLAAQIYNVKNQLAPWTNKGDDGMQITLSEMPYGYQIRNNAPQVFKAQDTLMAHSLPFFDWTVGDAGSDSTAGKVQNDLNYMVKNGLGKKIIISQTGWPSNADIWKPNSAKAVASLQQEKAYFDMLDNLACSWMAKNGPKGGIAWFSHMYADTLSGWGVLDTNWKAKFDFKPKTSC